VARATRTSATTWAATTNAARDTYTSGSHFRPADAPHPHPLPVLVTGPLLLLLLLLLLQLLLLFLFLNYCHCCSWKDFKPRVLTCCFYGNVWDFRIELTWVAGERGRSCGQWLAFMDQPVRASTFVKCFHLLMDQGTSGLGLGYQTHWYSECGSQKAGNAW